MAGKSFAQVNCSLLKSRKLKGCSHSERWAYLCAHLTPLGNFSGRFSYPKVMWAQDANLGVDELDAAIASLIDRKLVEFSDDEEVLRIVGFHRQRPPENACRMISIIGDFSSEVVERGTCEDMRLNSIVEFVVASVQRAQGWKPESPDWLKLREAFKPFLRQIYQEDGNSFLIALRAELEFVGKAAKQEINSLFPPLLEFEVEPILTPCPHPPLTRDVDLDVEETRLRGDEYKYEEDTKTGRNPNLEIIAGSAHSDSSGLPRNGSSRDVGSKPLGPLESTKKSALAMGA